MKLVNVTTGEVFTPKWTDGKLFTNCVTKSGKPDERSYKNHIGLIKYKSNYRVEGNYTDYNPELEAKAQPIRDEIISLTKRINELKVALKEVYPFTITNPD